MKTIKTEVFTIDELNAKAKERAREWYKEGDNMHFLEDYMQELLVDLLARHKIECENPKVFYSLSYSQGDGAMFEGFLQYKGHNITVKQTGHYYHAYSKEIDYPEASEREYADFEKLYTKICKELEREGYNWIEQERSDESVDDNIRANEYTFTKDGKRFG